MKQVNILVTGIGGGGHGEQIVKSLKLIKDLKINLAGTDVTDLTTGKKIVDIFKKVPYANSPEYKDILTDIIKDYQIDFIFHGSEPELKFISENRELLKAMGVKYSINSAKLIELCMNKFNTYKKLESLGIKVPKFLKINTIEDIKLISFFPVVLKPNTSSGGSSNVFIAFDDDELELLTKYMLKRKVDIVAQEYVGSKEEEFTIGVSSDNKGNVLGSIVVQRIISNALTTRFNTKNEYKVFTISSGISQGKICHIPALQKLAEEIAFKLNSKGPLNIQCRFVNGTLYLMEINPRLSGTTYLRALAGYNEPEMMIKHYLFNLPWKVEYKDIVVLRTIKEVII